MILYIDPGTGGLIISLILSYFITLIVFFKKIIIKIVSFFSFKTSKKNDFSGEIVLFSEGKNYWNVFSPIIEQLVIKKQSFVYLSCDKKDPGLSMGNSLISSHSSEFTSFQSKKELKNCSFNFIISSFLCMYISHIMKKRSQKFWDIYC